MHIKKGAIIQFYLFSNTPGEKYLKIVGKVIEVTDYDIVIRPQQLIAEDYIKDKNQPIYANDIYRLQTMDEIKEIHIDKNSIFAWEYFKVPYKSKQKYTDYVLRKDIIAGKYASDMINVYNYMTYKCEGYDEYLE